MKGVDSKGREVFKEKPSVDRVITGASDTELRCILSRFLLSKGIRPERASKVMRCSRSQLYADQHRGRSIIAHLLNGASAE